MEINKFEATNTTIQRAKGISDNVIGRIVEALRFTLEPLTLKEITNYVNAGRNRDIHWYGYSEQTIREYLHNMIVAKLVECDVRKEETIQVKTGERVTIDQTGEASRIEVTDSMCRTFIIDNPYFHANQKPLTTGYLEKTIQVTRYYYSLAKKDA